jgi:hypothetical protein
MIGPLHHPVPDDAVVLRPLDLPPPVNEIGAGTIHGTEQPSVLIEPPSHILTLENEEIINGSDEGGRQVMNYIPPPNAELHILDAGPGEVKSELLELQEKWKRRGTPAPFPVGGFVVGAVATGLVLGLWGLFRKGVKDKRSHARQWKPESDES